MVDRTTPVTCPFKTSVMKHHQLVVSGQPDIQFHAIGTRIPSPLECRQGIFRCRTQVTAMSDY